METRISYTPSAMQQASAEQSSKPFEARTRQLTGAQVQPQLTDEELDRLVELRNGRVRVRLSPGSEVPGTRYCIDGWLGDGGTGVVFEATHEDLGRKVAMKVLHSEHSDDPEMLQTFREEARAATKIGSPYIVEVIDFAELPDGRLLYVMERLRGVSLDREVEQAPMAMERLIPILRQACKGLGAAHDAGLVHRDIKPEHLLVLDPREPLANGRRDRIKIMDFGIAAVMGQSVDIQGTPSYMAPEQVLGMGVARQNDIYSLGCSAYELLVGRPPFRGANLREILRKHMREKPTPPHEVVGRQAVHPALEAVILKCLAKKKVERYPDMRELEAALVEAQLEAGIKTGWDDLPLPEVASERVDAMREGLAALHAGEPTKRRYPWWAPALLGAALTGAVALVGLQFWREEAPTEVIDEVAARVDRISREAKDAAAKALYFYPPVEDQNVPTAYSKVLELESFTEPEEQASGLPRAQELRSEFAATLERLGDAYWDKEGGKSFATDYYIQALMFDAQRERALARASITPGERIELRRKAEERAFSREELEAGDVLAMLATPDPEHREDKLRRWMKERRGRASSSFVRSARIEQFVLGEGVGVDPAPPEAPPPSMDALRAAMEDALIAPPSSISAANLDEDGDDPRSRRDPAAARIVAEKATKALRAGRWEEASQQFHAALAIDRTCTSALIGLSDLHFEKAEHGDAVRYAKMAVAAAPRRASYRVKYGDALVKVLEYATAREQYEMAIELGSHEAKSRLKRLEDKTGG